MRSFVEEMRQLDECDMEEFSRLESSEKTIAIVGDRWRRQTAKKDGDRISKQVYVIYGKSLMSAQTVEISIRRGTVFRLEKDAWSTVKCPRQTTNEPPPPPPPPSIGRL